jgi:hypothetical protein
MRRLRERGAITIATALIGAGVVTGGVGVGVALEQSGALGDDDESVAVSLDSVSTFDCPDGTAVVEMHRGDRVLATAQDASGEWIEIRDPRDLGARVWIAAAYLVPDGALSGLDERECAVDGEETAAPTLPGDTLPADVTTTTRAGGDPAPGPPPDTIGPSIGAVGANPNHIFGSQPASCSPTTTVVSVSASDPSGVQSITVTWSVGTSSGTAVPQGGGYRVGPIGFQPNLNASPVALTVTASDNAGNQSVVNNTSALTASHCLT